MVFSPHMKFLINAGFILFFALNSQATKYEGLISKNGPRFFLFLSTTEKKVRLSFVNPEIENQISKLKVNDFISLEGCLHPETNTISVDSVNYVGLNDLLGNWKGNDTYCYQFKTYLTMTVYNKNENGQCDFSVGHLARDFSSIINPSTPAWSVLLSDNDDTYLMDLNLHSQKSAELSLYDSRSGDIITHIQLKR
jgi:hypothetical protein